MLAMISSVLGGPSVKAALLPASGVMFALLLMANAIQSARLAHAKADLVDVQREATDLRTQASTCFLDRTNLRSAMAAQNAALDVQKADSAHRAVQLAAALADAQESAAQADRKARELQAHRITGSDVCTRLLDVDRAITGH